MKDLLTLFIILAITSSCKEKTRYQLALLLENTTENEIEIVVYPKSQFITVPGCYDFCDFAVDARKQISVKNPVESHDYTFVISNDKIR